MNYDVIGDIHGQAGKLTALLQKLGYRDHLGAWRHPDRNAIFVGDLIDRGPGNLETIGIVRGMLDAGTGMAVMGNHEFNAIAWHTPDARHDGQFLRRRNEKNRNQHATFLAEIEHQPKLHREQIDWFLTLPLWIDLPELRVVHACWHPGYMAELEPLLRPGRRLDEELVVASSRRGTMEYRTVEGLIKGLEVALPADHEFRDKDEYVRHNVRVRWWDANANTYRKAAILGSSAKENELPDSAIPEWALIGYDNRKPVFFGHYWFTGVPKTISDSVACVDYSAAKGGPLVAYRWEGEPRLSADRFISA